MEYNSEHIAIGFTGQVLIVVSCASLLAALVCYIFSCNEKLLNFRSWRFFGRQFFRLHFYTVVAAMGVLCYMLICHHIEYKYVWEHTSSGLSLGCLISSFWEGQEGSLLLWLFWQGLMGVLLFRRSGDFERPVMVVFSISQLFLNAALLGIHIGSIKIGNDPFMLLRNTPENLLNPFFSNADYLGFLKTGAGLNPLIQNFWMKAHTPVLFLGFAAMLVPFSYALAALWKQKYSGWLRPVIPWTSFGILALGAGLLMGSAWAYEDLTSGGFWSWDPVKNSSLVPWITLVISLHLVMVSVVNKRALFPAFLLTFLSYVFVLYSTFLTRSGILGTTSAHAFGTTELTWHFGIYLTAFFIISLSFLLLKAKKLTKSDKVKFLSREFWMAIGCVVLMLSAFQIIFSTSVPLINKIFGTALSIPFDKEAHYNAWQVPFAAITLLALAFTQFLTYGKNFFPVILRKFLPSFLISFLLSILFYAFSGESDFEILFLSVSSVFVIVSTFDIMLRFYRYSRNFPSLLGHLGLGIFIFGIIVAFSQSRIISENVLPVNMGKCFNASENMLLPKDTLLQAGNYFLRYTGSEKKEDKTFYHIHFCKKGDDGVFTEKFSISPSITAGTMGSIYTPDTKHFYNRDIFTYVMYAESGVTNDNTEFIIIKSTLFPYVRVMWTGGIIMLTGFLLSIIKRRKFRVPSESEIENS
ncbi:MAG: cytochrome c biogenesis protein CcsA [Bacteroidota bacterium]